MTRSFQRSPLALAILGLLAESPMHPYRMQQLIKERGKDQVINVQRRASLYQTINQLAKAGLIEARETLREENRPERTIYGLTEDGLRTMRDWMREALSTIAQEFPDFPAAVSFLALLTPTDALRQLEMREIALSKKLAHMDAEMGEAAISVPRLFLLEGEYLRAMLETELTWVRSIIIDLRDGRVTWNEEWLRGMLPPAPEE